MALFTHDSLRTAFQMARDAWSATNVSKWELEHLFRVDPARGFPQAGTHLTAFSTALFAEFAARSVPTDQDIARVAYRGVQRSKQTPLHALIQARLPSLTLEAREALTLDFAIVTRIDSKVPFTVGLAMESEMKPIASKGLDPHRLVADLVKLCLLHTGPKLFLCRANGGKESSKAGKVLKLTRVLTTIQNTLRACALVPTVGPSTEVAALLLETLPKPPWTVFTVVLDPPNPDTREPSYESFDPSA